MGGLQATHCAYIFAPTRDFKILISTKHKVSSKDQGNDHRVGRLRAHFEIPFDTIFIFFGTFV